jgi:predicted transcriptional regulator
MVERVAEIREQMATVDGAYAQSLVAIRKAADLTQVELATQMGVAQPEISRIENCHDMLLSTLTSYLSAVGERPRVVVTVNDKDVELDLTTLGRRTLTLDAVSKVAAGRRCPRSSQVPREGAGRS